MKSKIFKVYFDIMVECNGMYKILPTSLTVLAENEEEAKEKFRKSIKFETKINDIDERKQAQE